MCCQRQGEDIGDMYFCYYSLSTRVCLAALNTEISESLVDVVSVLILWTVDAFIYVFIVECLNSRVTLPMEIDWNLDN